MENRTKAAIALAIAGIIVVMIGCMKARKHSLKIRTMRTDVAATHTAATKTDLQTDRLANQGLPAKEKIQLKEFETMKKMASLMKAQMEEPSSRGLTRDLQVLGLGPLPSYSNGLTTGRVTVISTSENPDPNTRYFWAQFRSEKDGSGEYMQIMTFEFRPGETAMEEAQEMAKQVFSLTREPDFKSAVAVSWDLNENYEVLINMINEAHLNEPVADRKFTAEDLGVIQFTVQAKSEAHSH